MAALLSSSSGVTLLRRLVPAMAKRRLRYLVEGAGAWLLFTFFRVLPFDWASAFGGFIGRNIGPHLGLDKRARDNLRRAMPDLDPVQIERIVRGMWDNLGRFVAEYPHLSQLQIFEPGGRVEIAGLDEILSKRSDGKRYICATTIIVAGRRQLGWPVNCRRLGFGR
jgi:lauroyl/myristoyl acyltransferase